MMKLFKKQAKQLNKKELIKKVKDLHTYKDYAGNDYFVGSKKMEYFESTCKHYMEKGFVVIKVEYYRIVLAKGTNKKIDIVELITEPKPYFL